jgi:hypothetical protein
MISYLLPSGDMSGGAPYRPVPAVYARAPVSEGRPLPIFGEVGTGGLASESFYRLRNGYAMFEVVESGKTKDAAQYAPFVGLMQTISAGFGRTKTRLPEVFGVSRQTLYNWSAGEAPKPHHHAKLRELAAAAAAFTRIGLKPTSTTLDRTIAQGKSFLQLLNEGANGEETALRLARIVKRANESRARLDSIVGARRGTRPEISEMGTPSFAEDV